MDKVKVKIIGWPNNNMFGDSVIIEVISTKKQFTVKKYMVFRDGDNAVIYANDLSSVQENASDG